MTDQLFDITQSGGVGRQPVTNVGRVVYNLMLDQDDCEHRKHVGASNTLWPDVSMEDRSFWVLPREICLSKKIKNAGRRRGGVSSNMIMAFSCLNGLQGTQSDIIENLTFAGVAGGPGVKFDTRGNEPRHPEFTGILGGLYTITNNGPNRIQNGDLVYWDLPDSTRGVPHRRNPSQVGRVTAVCKPYRPSENKASAAVLKERVMRSVEEPSKFQPKTNKLDGAAEALMHFAFSGMLIGAKLHGAVAQDIEVLARGLGMLDSRAADPRTRAADPRTRAAAIRLLAAKAPIFATEEERQSSAKKQINLMQKSVLNDAIAAMEQGSQYVTDRIFCKALTPASANSEFVATFGHYRQ